MTDLELTITVCIGIILGTILAIAPQITSLLAIFKVQKPFAKEMVKREVITKEAYIYAERVLITNTGLMAIFEMVILVLVCVRFQPFSYPAAVIGLGYGIWRNKERFEFSKGVVRMFETNYAGNYDKDKLLEYIEETFGEEEEE